MKIRKRFLIFMVIFLFGQVPVITYAASVQRNDPPFSNTSPWMKDTSDESIYSNPIDAEEEVQDIRAKKPGWVEKYIAELFRNIGSSIISLLQNNIGASLDSIVYGRVGSGQPNKVNIYSFELRKGNPYGVTASVCYALLRGMMFILLGVTFVFQLAKAAWNGQSAKSREEIKGILPTMIFKFAVLMLMPYLLDVAIYVRDVLLYGIKEVTGQMITGGATLSLSKSFLQNAERSGTFVDAVMYLGTVALTIYFVFLYVAVAMDMLICFISFPFLCVIHSRKKDLVTSWIMTVFSNLITPIIDAVLLLIPLLTSIMLSDTIKGVAIIQLVMCMLIIPARSRFKSLLGVQNNDRNGFIGAMAMMAMAKSVGGRIKQGVGKLMEAYSDAKKSRMYGEMAKVDQEESEYLLGNSTSTGQENVPQEPMRTEQELFQNPDENTEKESEVKYSNTETVEGLQDRLDEILPEEETPLSQEPADRDLERMQNISEGKSGIPETEEENATIPPTEEDLLHENAATPAELLQNAQTTEADAQAKINQLKLERAELQQEEKQLKRQMLHHDRGTLAYKQLEDARAGVECRIAAIDGRIAKEGIRLNQARKEAKTLQNAIGIHHAPTNFDEKRNEILRKRVTISNFETPDFKGVLSNEQMKDLYRKRAVANAVKCATGTVTSVIGGAALGGAATFMGPSAMGMGASAGVYIGGNLGEHAVDAALEAKRLTVPAAKYISRSISRAADMAASAYLLNKMKPAAMQINPDWSSPTTETGIMEKTSTIPIKENNSKQPPLFATPEVKQEKIMVDASDAISQMIDMQANIKNSSALFALQKANIQVEREIAAIKEEGSVIITEEFIRNKRIDSQTEALSEEILHRMHSLSGYDKSSDTYREVKQLVQNRVREILEEKSRPII